MRAYFSAFVIATIMLGAAPAKAQSLADVARREAERRKTVKDDGKVLTNRDVPEVHRSEPVPEVPVEPSDADAAGQPKPADETQPAADVADAEKTATDGAQPKGGQQKGQKYWSDRQATLHLQLERDQSYAEALQSRINALTTDFVNRDDPAQQSVIANDRQKALTELSRLSAAIDTDKKVIVDFEEEARRAAVPPGWLR